MPGGGDGDLRGAGADGPHPAALVHGGDLRIGGRELGVRSQVEREPVGGGAEYLDGVRVPVVANLDGRRRDGDGLRGGGRGGEEEQCGGEKVAAAVILKSGAQFDEQALQKLCAARLAPFKVPAVIRAFDDLPRNSTGKVQRRDVVPMMKAQGI